MHGLKQAAILAYDNLKQCLKPFGYNSVTGTVGVWKNETIKPNLCLCVGGFGIKYYSKVDANHLFNAIGKITDILLTGLAKIIVVCRLIGLTHKDMSTS